MIAGGGILILLIGIGAYGLLRGPASTAPPSTATSSASNPGVAAPVMQPRPLAATARSEVFARSVADSLFRWDTRSSAGPAEWSQPLIDVGDADEAAGLASDVRGYLPTVEQWDQLEMYGTVQRLTIDVIRVPAAWAGAVAQAAPGQLPPGAIAYTISGIRHRNGTWDGEPTTTASEVTFTVFIACPRDQHCRLLRLSRLNEPLE
ncbi:hypothetical protein GCM10009777_36610 [Microbacterium pumilum]|uniref:Secreted protein n=1 Tax=Microbacterium pumilum TaxID=344165 RepID=A0ABP5EIC5_9MICO